MSVVSRVALAALLCLAFVAGAVAQTGSYTFCYKLVGLKSSTLDDPFSLAVLVSGTYNTTLQTSVATKFTPVGQYYTLLTATGTRTIATRNKINVTQTISSLAPVNTLFSDNRFYISNASFPQFVDGDGLTFNLSTASAFPGKLVATQYNLYRSGTYGAVLEDKTTGLNLTTVVVSANFPNWTGTAYVAGSCTPLPLASTATPATAPAAGTYRITVFYNISSTATEPAWNVVVNAAFSSDGVVYGPDSFGDYSFHLSTARLAVNGTRVYCILGACSTSNIYAAAVPGSAAGAGFADNFVYRYSPYFDYNGIAYLLDPAQPKPGFTSTNTTTSVNPYVSKAGQFFEGFGVGGTGPNGRADTTLTKMTVSIVKIA